MKLAKDNNPKALYSLGDMFERGRGTPKDLEQAAIWYSKAAAKGHKKAAFKLGLAYLKGLGVTADQMQAFKWLQLSAAKGYERAQFYLAEMFENGLGVTQDLEEALRLYIQSRDGGYSPAITRVERVSNSLAHMAEIVKKEKELKSKAALAVKTRATHAIPQPTAPQFDTLTILIQGGWMRKQHPIAYMPSKTTECKTTGTMIECLSEQQTRNIGTTQIKFNTKAVLYNIKDSGEFKISYRNNVSDIDAKEDQDNSATHNIDLGWQDMEHLLDCKLLTASELSCIKNKTRKLQIVR
ncbi:MAG: sel1 repeat family protein [Gammaproteobacteria bacterium]|nr:sel1 repeat family protein [Gammaproteobacteria bacterium]